MKTYHLFISHSWTHSDAYDRLKKLLENKPYFYFKDYSVPRNDPIHTTGTDAQLSQAIREHMLPCSAVLILAGVYVEYSKWIKKEIAIAQGFTVPKPTIAIEDWGSKRTSLIAKENADRTVRMNTDSIVLAIRELVR